jgi:crossover junction endodeoxyribonuclease RuvC
MFYVAERGREMSRVELFEKIRNDHRQGASIRSLADKYRVHRRTVKQAITSYGRADKRQVQEMVKALLNLPAIPRPDDAADGLAIAICHAFSSSLPGKVGVGK